MIEIVRRVKESPQAKIYILITFCVITTLIFLLHSSDIEEHNSVLANMPSDTKTGGLGRARDKDSEVVGVVDKIKPVLEEKTGLKFDSLEPIQYKLQTVAGTNFFVKVKAQVTGGDSKIIHLRIYRNLQRSLELTAFQMDKAESDEILHFEKT